MGNTAKSLEPSTMESREMHLAVLMNGTGNHVGGWRLPEADVGAVDLDILNRITQSAERGKFDMVFLADTLAASASATPDSIMCLEVLSVLAALSMTTRHIGLSATVSTQYTEPYNLARALSSLDHISHGRIGWNVVTSSDPLCATNFGLGEHPPKEDRYRRAAEFLAVCKGLWDSWEDGALLQDKASGRFVDLSKRHELNHVGEFFAVKGPLNIARMPQGYPVIIQAGSSNAAMPFASAAGEVLFGVQDTLESAKAFSDKVRAAAAAQGRDPGSIRILQGIAPIVVSGEEEGKAMLAKLTSVTDPAAAWSLLSIRLGMDISHLPPEGPVPKIPPDQMRGYARTLIGAAERYNFNLRELRDYAAAAAGHYLVMGPPEKIAEEMASWFEAGAADGFILMPPWFTGAFDQFVDQVVPLLQKRGIYRKDYTGTTLRDHLGLPRPAHPNARTNQARVFAE